MRMVKKKTYKEIDCPNGKELYETIVNTIAMLKLFHRIGFETKSEFGKTEEF